MSQIDPENDPIQTPDATTSNTPAKGTVRSARRPVGVERAARFRELQQRLDYRYREPRTKDSEAERHAVHFSSKRTDWETPPEIFQRLDEEFHFTLDAAANGQNAKVVSYYTEEDDALQQTWTGTVWLNPPFGRQIVRWVEKAIRSADEGATVVLLVPARTDSIWFQQLAQRAEEVRLLAGRVTFVGASEPAPFPTAVAVLRPRAVSWSRTGEASFVMPTRHGSSPWSRMWKVG